MKVKMISTDGYNDWNVTRVSDITMDEFTIDGCVHYISGGECNNSEEYFGPGGGGTHVKTVITINGEESGYTFVLME